MIGNKLIVIFLKHLIIKEKKIANTRKFATENVDK